MLEYINKIEKKFKPQYKKTKLLNKKGNLRGFEGIKRNINWLYKKSEKILRNF